MPITDNDPRVITEREIFDEIYYNRWSACMDMSKKKATEFGNNATYGEICQGAATLFIAWNQNASEINYLKGKRQEEWDKRFPPVVRK